MAEFVNLNPSELNALHELNPAESKQIALWMNVSCPPTWK